MPDNIMTRGLRPTFLVLSLLAAAPVIVAQPPEYAITLYNMRDAEALFAGPVDFEPPPGQALVHERRRIEVGAGRGTMTLNGFPLHLDATALSVTMESGHVLDQRFDSEPLRSERILERSVGRRVSIEQAIAGEAVALTGELLSASLPLALRLDDGSIMTVNDYSRLHLLSPPAGFNALPQLRLGVESARAGMQTVDLTYPARGLAWRADYLVRLKNDRDCRLDLSGFAQVVNRSGHGFQNASVRLVAGDLFRSDDGAAATVTGKSDFSELKNALDDEHSLKTPIDIPDGSIQQVALIPEQRNLRCAREQVYTGTSLRVQPHRVPITEAGYGRNGNRRVHHALTFMADDEAPMPAGRMRVLILDRQDGTPRFLAEQDIGPVSAGDTLEVMLHEVPTLEGQRTVSGHALDESGLGLSETIRIVLRNRGDMKAEVRVRDYLYRWKRWSIAGNTHPYERRDHDAIEFRVDVPANGESQVSYRVNYRWTERFR